MAQTLTIRNLTAVTVELKLAELCEQNAKERSKTLHKGTTNSTIRSGNSNVSLQYEEYRAREGNAIRLEPFTTANMEKLAELLHAMGSMRLTLNIEGQTFHITVSSTGSIQQELASSSCVPMRHNPRLTPTGIFDVEEAILSLYSCPALDNWMATLPDAVMLSLLSIPGTHNSPTHYKALPSVRCQAATVRSQLDNGIRFLDIRVQPEHASRLDRDGLILVHGVFPISLTGRKYLRPVLRDVESFLAAHPSETVIVSLKREGTGDATDAHLSLLLLQHYASDSGRWWTLPRIPRLGEVRGRIVLVRRFSLHEDLRALHNGMGWGIDAENWADNSPHSDHGTICVQDFYDLRSQRDIDDKVHFVQAHLERAAALSRLDGREESETEPQPPLYLNFLSASNFWRTSCWPYRVAARINPAVLKYLFVQHPKLDGSDGDDHPRRSANVSTDGTGVVIMDWVGHGGDWTLVRGIVGMNARLMAGRCK